MNMTILEETLSCVRNRMPAAKPLCSIILGSGWGETVSGLDVKTSIDYADIPHMGRTTVQSHAGRLLLAECSGIAVLVFQGRRHWYEGAGWEPIAIPVHVSLHLGVTHIVLTNAAGSLRQKLKPGSLIAIDDHINLMGTNPLIGEHHPQWGPRFPDMTTVYDQELRRLLDNAALNTGLDLMHGVYAATSGPAYETPAESALLRSSGADVVGMSTVPEAILAHAAGIRVAGLSCVTNYAATAECDSLSHKTIVTTAANSLPNMKSLLETFLNLLASNG
jgi:purine-nucleoside phosphorylase